MSNPQKFNFFGLVGFTLKPVVFFKVVVFLFWNFVMLNCILRFSILKKKMVCLTASAGLAKFLTKSIGEAFDAIQVGQPFYKGGGLFTNFEMLKWFCFYEGLLMPITKPKIVLVMDCHYSKAFLNDVRLSKALAVFFINLRHQWKTTAHALLFFLQLWSSKNSIFIHNLLFIISGLKRCKHLCMA